MIDITKDQRLKIATVNAVMKHLYGADCFGASVGRNQTRVHLQDDIDTSLAENYFNNVDKLNVTVDKHTIDGDNVDTATVTINDALISGDAVLFYTVVDANGVLLASDTVDVTAGSATLEFATNLANVYTISVSRVDGNYASGSVTITVNEV